MTKKEFIRITSLKKCGVPNKIIVEALLHKEFSQGTAKALSECCSSAAHAIDKYYQEVYRDESN